MLEMLKSIQDFEIVTLTSNNEIIITIDFVNFWYKKKKI